jgi:glycosyltransferase involved in cell wall biosynthesis
MSQPASRPAIGYWIFNYMPHWEAASKEVDKLLSAAEPEFRARLMALNMTGQRLRLDRNRTTLPMPYALAALPWLKRMAMQHHINHVVASAAERILLPRFNPQRTILTVAKAAPLAAIERNLPVLRTLRCIVVESERDLDLLRQGGVSRETTQLVYPGVEIHPYAPPPDPFTILFATSPLGRHDLLSRGIHLLIRVAQDLPDVRFLLIWRERNIEELTALVAAAGTANIVIRNGYIPDMPAVYDSVHATALPGLEFISIKPCPHSALESLAHGKPLLVSQPSSLASLVTRTGCGVVFAPVVADLRRAITELRSGYNRYQATCHTVIRQHFREDECRQRYLKIYRAILAEADEPG